MEKPTNLSMTTREFLVCCLVEEIKIHFWNKYSVQLRICCYIVLFDIHENSKGNGTVRRAIRIFVVDLEGKSTLSAAMKG